MPTKQWPAPRSDGMNTAPDTRTHVRNARTHSHTLPHMREHAQLRTLKASWVGRTRSWRTDQEAQALSQTVSCRANSSQRQNSGVAGATMPSEAPNAPSIRLDCSLVPYFSR